MAMEQNGAGNQGAAGRCGEAACAAGAGLWQGRAEGAGAASASAHPADGVGDAQAPLLGLAPGPAPSAHAPGTRRGCDGQLPSMPRCATPRVPGRASKAARRRAVLPPLACRPSLLSLLPQGLSPSSPRQGLPYQACHPGYLIWVSQLPHLEKMCLRIPSAGTALPGAGGCCHSLCARCQPQHPPPHLGTILPKQLPRGRGRDRSGAGAGLSESSYCQRAAGGLSAGALVLGFLGHPEGPQQPAVHPAAATRSPSPSSAGLLVCGKFGSTPASCSPVPERVG